MKSFSDEPVFHMYMLLYYGKYILSTLKKIILNRLNLIQSLFKKRYIFLFVAVKSNIFVNPFPTNVSPTEKPGSSFEQANS